MARENPTWGYTRLQGALKNLGYELGPNTIKRVLAEHGIGCLRCLLLVMCTHPFAKEALTLHLARSEGHERYFGCNLMHRKVLASSHQHLMAEAPRERLGGILNYYCRAA